MRAVVRAALFAESVNLEGVTGGDVAVLAANFLFELADFGREEFHRTAASSAYHVMVAAAVVLVLVAGNAVMKRDFTGEAALSQKFQRAVDGGVADTGIFLLDEAMQFVGGEVVAGFEEGAEDGIALGGLFESDVFQMAVENILGFAHHLARERGLIVNAFLQHEGSESGYHRSNLKLKFIFRTASRPLLYNQNFPHAHDG